MAEIPVCECGWCDECRKAVQSPDDVPVVYYPAPIPSSPDEAAIDSLAVALGVEPSPAVPERARHNQDDYQSPKAKLFAAALNAENRAIDWESRCRQVEAELAQALRARIAEHDGAGNADRAPHHRVAGGDPNG